MLIMIHYLWTPSITTFIISKNTVIQLGRIPGVTLPKYDSFDRTRYNIRYQGHFYVARFIFEFDFPAFIFTLTTDISDAESRQQNLNSQTLSIKSGLVPVMNYSGPDTVICIVGIILYHNISLQVSETYKSNYHRWIITNDAYK